MLTYFGIPFKSFPQCCLQLIDYYQKNVNAKFVSAICIAALQLIPLAKVASTLRAKANVLRTSDTLDTSLAFLKVVKSITV